MKNRAKCKKCQSTIESYHDFDYVSCQCGEISVSGGAKMECAAMDWVNFIRVDDMGNEVIPKIQDKDDVKPLYIEKPTKSDLIKMLDEMIESIERLPTNAMTAPRSNYDHCAALILIASILKSKD